MHGPLAILAAVLIVLYAASSPTHAANLTHTLAGAVSGVAHGLGAFVDDLDNHPAKEQQP